MLGFFYLCVWVIHWWDKRGQAETNCCNWPEEADDVQREWQLSLEGEKRSNNAGVTNND